MNLKGLDIYFELESKTCWLIFTLKGMMIFIFPCSRYSAGALLINAQEQVSARREYGLFRLSPCGRGADARG